MMIARTGFFAELRRLELSFWRSGVATAVGYRLHRRTNRSNKALDTLQGLV